MAFYESVFIARQDASAKQVEELTEKFTKIITENGGKVAGTESWGLRTLAYRINKNRKGHYVMLVLDTPHAAVAEMERQMKLHEDILRYMTVRIDALPTEPSAMMRVNDDEGDKKPRRRA